MFITVFIVFIFSGNIIYLVVFDRIFTVARISGHLLVTRTNLCHMMRNASNCASFLSGFMFLCNILLLESELCLC